MGYIYDAMTKAEGGAPRRRRRKASGPTKPGTSESAGAVETPEAPQTPSTPGIAEANAEAAAASSSPEAEGRSEAAGYSTAACHDAHTVEPHDEPMPIIGRVSIDPALIQVTTNTNRVAKSLAALDLISRRRAELELDRVRRAAIDIADQAAAAQADAASTSPAFDDDAMSMDVMPEETGSEEAAAPALAFEPATGIETDDPAPILAIDPIESVAMPSAESDVVAAEIRPEAEPITVAAAPEPGIAEPCSTPEAMPAAAEATSESAPEAFNAGAPEVVDIPADVALAQSASQPEASEQAFQTESNAVAPVTAPIADAAEESVVVGADAPLVGDESVAAVNAEAEIPAQETIAPATEATAAHAEAAAEDSTEYGPDVLMRFDPNGGAKLDERLVSATDPLSIMAEEYRSIRTGILARWQQKKHIVHLITSATPQEGKTITSLNLGLSFAELNSRRTIVVEADLRLPQFSTLLGLPQGPGIIDVLEGKIELDKVITRLPGSGLHVIAAGGRAATQAMQLLSTGVMASLIKRLRQEYDHVIIDTPPVVQLADAGILGSLCDDVMLVVRLGRTPSALVDQAIRTLTSYNAPVSGVLATDDKHYRHRYHYKYEYRYAHKGRRSAA
ncbi:MAG: AAA family ATPase [Planctomycetota bacterium]|nr:AAA family ATPase [Planctomycetota bacterium]